MTATQTKTKPKTTTEAVSIARRMTADASALFEAAEEILFSLGPNDTPTVEQWLVLRQAGIDTRDQIEREQTRVATVKQLLAAAGTESDFQHASTATLLAVAAERQQLPELEAARDAIQRKIDDLAEARAAAERQLAPLQMARNQLRNINLLPPYIQRRFERERQSRVDGQTSRRIAELETRKSCIEGLKLLHSTDRAALLHAEAAAPHLIQRALAAEQIDHLGRPMNSMVVQKLHGWEQYVKSRVAELPAIERELAELRGRRDEALTSADEVLDFYVAKIQ